MKALLIIDMQLGSFRPYTLRYDTMAVIGRINGLSEYFRAQHDKVIFIQHDGTKENAFIPGTDDWSLLPELARHAGDEVISKTANDAFYKTALQSFLEKHNITEIFITGCATDFCIDATVKSALSRDYTITVVEDAHTTADRPHMDAPTVIMHYNWLWADMTPTVSGIIVRKTSEVMDNAHTSMIPSIA